MLGPFQATFGGRALDSFRTSKVQALLIYLLVRSIEEPTQGVGREQLMALLWPEMPRKSAQDNLRQTLYHLRRTIPEVTGPGDETVPFILSDRQRVQINPAAHHRLDVVIFTTLAERGGPKQLSEAVELYRGDFLADFYLEDSNEFEAWAAGWRGRLQRQALEAFDHLAAYHLERGEASLAATYARRMLVIDDLRESGHRRLMEALGQMGKRAEALRQYERCQMLLKEQLGVAPSVETEEVVKAIRQGVRAGWRLGSLPAPETPIIGRDRELADIMRLLGDGARLVSIVGPGGIGKTRLALEVARAIVSEDGKKEALEEALSLKRVIFVNLATLSEAEEVAPTVARALEPTFSEVDRETLRQQLLEYLRGQKLLLVLDNFEYLLEEAALLKEILRAAADVKLLVTSRERLRLQAEHVYPLSGLAYSEWTTPVEASRDAAVQLFQQQARRVRPAFRLRSEHLAPLRMIVTLTEGMPLALILAAGWVKVLGPAEIATELGRSLDFLQATNRDVPPRQRSMRAVFETTWERLGDGERAIFAALSAFRGGFTLEAAQAVAGARPGALLQLADRSLITRIEAGRFEVHELLRQFAEERLEEREEAEAVRYAHSAYYCDFLKQREDQMKGPRVDEATAEITADLDNVRAAWRWATDNGQGTLLQQAATPFAIYADRRHLNREAATRFLRASEALSEVAGASPTALGTLLLWAGTWLFYGDPSGRHRSERCVRQALTYLDEAAESGKDVRLERAWAFLALGNTMRHDFEQAVAYTEASLELFSELGLRWEMAYTHERLGGKYIRPGDYRRARVHYQESHRLFVEVDHRPFALFMQGNLAYLNAVTGRLPQAVSGLREVVVAHQESGDQAYQAMAQMRLGEALIYSGRFQEAISLLEALQDRERSWGNPFVPSNSRLMNNWATLHEGRYKEAQEEATAMLATARDFDQEYNIGLTDLILGCVALAMREIDEARRYLHHSATAFGAIDQRDESGWVRAGLGYLALQEGDVDAARTHLVKALRYIPDYQHFLCALMVMPAVALLFAEVDEKVRAVELYALASRHGFVANSHWFEDVAGRRMAAITESLSAKATAEAKARGAALNLWETAGALLAELKGMELIERI